MAKKPATPKSETTAAAAAVAPQMPQFKLKRIVTLPVMPLRVDVPVLVQINQPFEDCTVTGRPLDADAEEQGIRAPVEVPVTDLMTGQHVALVAGHRLQEVFDNAYPDNSYVGLQFQIIRKRIERRTRMGGKTGQNQYMIAEVEIESPEAA